MKLSVKTRIQIIKYTIWTAFLIGLVSYYSTFKEGFDYGYNRTMQRFEAGEKLVDVYYTQLPIDAEDTQRSMPVEVSEPDFRVTAQVGSVKIFLETDDFGTSIYSFGEKFARGIITILKLSCLVLIFIFLIRFLNACEKGQIFTRKNIRRIRFSGLALLILPILKICYLKIDASVYSKLIKIEGYEISQSFTMINYSFIIVGIVALLVAELFRISKDMQEEQSLTV
jgi:hypothetical protein